MKNMYKMTLLAVGLLIVTANLSAQNRYTFGDGKTHSNIIETSENVKVTQIDNQTVSFSFGKERTRPERVNATTHTLTINVIDGDVVVKIGVTSGENYFNYVENQSNYSDEVEEGYYDIVIQGYYHDENISPNTLTGYITYNQVPVFEDVTLDASFDECVYCINDINVIDENGQFLVLDNAKIEYEFLYSWSNRTWSFGDLGIGLGGTNPLQSLINRIRFNGFDESCYICLTASIYPQNQVVYSINFSNGYGLSDNVVFENNPEEFIAHKEKYKLMHSDSDTAHYYLDWYLVYGENTYLAMAGMVGLDENQLLVDTPLTIISNNKIEDPAVYTDVPHILLRPVIYESYPDENWPFSYENAIASLGMYYNADNELVYEPFGRLRDTYEFFSLPSYLGYFPITPALSGNYTNAITFGERTPASYYQAFALKSSQLFSGQNIFKPYVFSFGENGCQRIGDRSAIATITYDGEEIFSDSLYKIRDQNYIVEGNGVVVMDIDNTHLNVDGIEKYNQTLIEFDFNREDVTAPTLTILQVMNEQHYESIEIPQLIGSYIMFAAGDFSPHYNEDIWFFDYMQYDDKPNIEVYFFTDMGEWLPLTYVEEEQMFHENYGNYFYIDLGQIDEMFNGELNDVWISLKFILTDDAGNKMEQVLYNVFYVGHWDSLNEQTTLSHIVYPNPFSNEVKITATETVNGEANIAVYNILGEQIYSKTENCTETEEFIIDGSTWKPGVYFYNISTENGMLQGKIIKE